MEEDDTGRTFPEASERALAKPGDSAPRRYRVEHRATGMDTVVLAVIDNVFPHHDTLTQFVSRFLNEQGAEPLCGELVLIEDATDKVLARRDLGRACTDGKRGRQRPKPPLDD